MDAPYVGEFPLILECKLIHTLEIGLHTLFIGEILDVKADEHVLGEKGFPDIEKARPIVFGPEIRTYHGIGKFLGQAFAIGRDLCSRMECPDQNVGCVLRTILDAGDAPYRPRLESLGTQAV